MISADPGQARGSAPGNRRFPQLLNNNFSMSSCYCCWCCCCCHMLLPFLYYYCFLTAFPIVSPSRAKNAPNNTFGHHSESAFLQGSRASNAAEQQNAVARRVEKLQKNIFQYGPEKCLTCLLDPQKEKMLHVSIFSVLLPFEYL